MKNVMFSEVKRAHSLLRFLWPVQSLAQVKTAALIYAFGLPLMALVVWLIDPDYLWVTLTGASVGGTGSFFLHLPATLELTTRGEARHFVGEVSDLLHQCNYAEAERCGSNLHFADLRQWPSWIPRYFRWKETEIDLAVHEHTITLRGPKLMLGIVKRRGERGTLQGALRF
jgi:hypothetical protein